MPRTVSSSRPVPQLGRLLAGALSLGLIAAGTVTATLAQAAIPGNAPTNCVASGASAICSFTYGFTGGEQRFTVPAGITSLDVTAIGASGGPFSSYPGGAGAAVTSSLDVVPNDVLFIQVGGNGGSGSLGGGGAPGYNGGAGSAPAQNQTARGAGGGGATDVRTSSGDLASRVVVAAGGGGAGGCAPGGAAGAAGSTNPGCSSFQPGQPGTSTAGGAGGVREFFGGGANGSLGSGGDGAFLGGGGGGGLYGGGGGAANAGGGGGSSLGTVTGYGGGSSVTLRYTSPITSLELNAQPTTAVAGSTVPFLVTGRNAQGDSLNATPVVTLSSSDVSDSASSGAIRFSKVGTRTVTASLGGLSVSQAVDVTVGAPASLAVTPSASTVTAGDSIAFTTRAVDGEGNDLGDRTASTLFTSTGPGGTADAVTGSSVRFTSAGSHTVTATDGSLSATATIAVNPSVLATIAFDSPSTTATAGTPVTFTVVGADEFGNSLGDYSSSAVLDTDDPRDVIVGNAVTFAAAGPRTITATVGGITAETSLTVVAGAVASVTVTPATSAVTAGDVVDFTVTGVDAYGNSLGDLTSSAVLSSTRATDSVRAPFPSIYFTETGSRVITATIGTVSDDVTVQVTPSALALIALSPANTTRVAGEDVTFTATGTDRFGNSLGDVTAQATFSTGDVRDVIDGATVVFAASGVRFVTAVIGSVDGISAITVTPGAPASLVVTPGTPAPIAGTDVGFTVTATDAYGNEIGDVTPDAELSSSEPTDEVNGAVVSVTRSGSRVVTATVGDFLGEVQGEVAFAVNPGAPASVSLGATSSAITAGGTFAFSVLGEDAFGNALGDVSADAVLSSDNPSDVVAGASITFGSVGSRTVTATVAGVSDTLAVVVLAAPIAPPAPVVPPTAPTAVAPAPRPSVLASTGGDVSGVGLGSLAILAGLALMVVGSRRRGNAPA